MDVYGRALLDFYCNRDPEELILHNNYGPAEEMPVDIFFRSDAEMPEIEQYALQCCRGRVLDIGAGVGSHALALQEKNIEVSALEISALASEIMRQRGVFNTINEDIFHFKKQKYDTLLMLMNGIGLTGNIKRLEIFLDHCKRIINRNGQLIVDSSDILYLHDHEPPGADEYYGEIAYQYEYKGTKGEWFQWLYIDYSTLATIARKKGWVSQMIYENDQDQFLARLVLE